jgi:hypothetical protein
MLDGGLGGGHFDWGGRAESHVRLGGLVKLVKTASDRRERLLQPYSAVLYYQDEILAFGVRGLVTGRGTKLGH